MLVSKHNSPKNQNTSCAAFKMVEQTSQITKTIPFSSCSEIQITEDMNNPPKNQNTSSAAFKMAEQIAQMPNTIPSSSCPEIKNPNDVSLLFDDMNKGIQSKAPRKHEKCIARVPSSLRDTEFCKGCFDPEIVSLGPYHHGKPNLKGMETYKIYAVKRFTDDPNLSGKACDFYTQLETVALEAKEYYDAQIDFTDYEFKKMMFVDSCFLLYSLIEFLSKENIQPLLNKNEHLSVLRDMILVENQIPFKVLNKLLSIKYGSSIPNERNPLYLFAELSVRYHLIINGDVKLGIQFEPVHLLDLVQMTMVGKDPDYNEYPLPIPMSEGDGDRDREYFTLTLESIEELGVEVRSSQEWATMADRLTSIPESVTKLQDTGITCCGREDRYLGDIDFENHRLHSVIWMPKIMVGQETKRFFLNTIAHEISGYDVDDRGVLAYIRFMNRLIHREEDMKELRAHKVIINKSLTDKHLMDLFIGLGKEDLAANPRAYRKVKEDIWDYYDSRLTHLRVKFIVFSRELYQTYFRSPWTMIGLIGAGVLLFLAAVQTYFTVFPQGQRKP